MPRRAPLGWFHQKQARRAYLTAFLPRCCYLRPSLPPRACPAYATLRTCPHLLAALLGMEYARIQASRCAYLQAATGAPTAEGIHIHRLWQHLALMALSASRYYLALLHPFFATPPLRTYFFFLHCHTIISARQSWRLWPVTVGRRTGQRGERVGAFRAEDDGLAGVPSGDAGFNSCLCRRSCATSLYAANLCHPHGPGRRRLTGYRGREDEALGGRRRRLAACASPGAPSAGTAILPAPRWRIAAVRLEHVARRRRFKPTAALPTTSASPRAAGWAREASVFESSFSCVRSFERWWQALAAAVMRCWRGVTAAAAGVFCAFLA